MVRPQKNFRARRSRQIIFRVSEAEYDLLCNKAEQAGISPNKLARRLSLNGRKQLVIQTSQRCDPAFIKRIDRIGQNLNQLVRKTHMTGSVPPEVPFVCGQINRLIDSVLNEEDDH